MMFALFIEWYVATSSLYCGCTNTSEGLLFQDLW